MIARASNETASWMERWLDMFVTLRNNNNTSGPAEDSWKEMLPQCYTITEECCCQTGVEVTGT